MTHSDLDVYHSTELLKDKTSTGKWKYWRGFAGTDGENFYRFSERWQTRKDGSDGKHIFSSPTQTEVKFEGQSNEVSAREQAILEIDRKAEKKRDKGYWADGEEKPEKLPLPMLAHRYDKRSHDIVWPAYAQPKLDGHRMLFNGTEGWTRKGKDYIPEVIEHLRCELPEDVILDGELMLPHGETFQSTTKAIKKFRPDVSPLLEYHVYDVIFPDHMDMAFEDRINLLKNYLLGDPDNGIEASVENDRIHFVQTELVRNESELMEWHTTWTDQGYEGSMIRNAEAPYKLKNRSKHLQKVKDFKDQEYRIVGFTEGTGRERGKILFICEAPDATCEDKTFTVRPKGSMEDRAEWFNNGDDFIGEDLTVVFQELSDEGIPRFPVGKAVRNL